MKWMLYGATGYTGVLVAEEAVKRGHTPLLAGRDESKLRPLARRLGLKYVAFGLDDVNIIAKHIAEMDVVYHCAGPFAFTSDAMIRACLATNTHYLDITGEVEVLENTFSYDEVARKNGIALISGVGFDVIPSDCLADYVSQQVPQAQTLVMGIQALSSVSAGTAKSMIEMLPYGLRWRKNGALSVAPINQRTRKFHLQTGEALGLLIPWGDIATAYRTTGIPNISVYMALNPALVRLVSVTASMGGLFKSAGVRRFASGIVDRVITPPTPAQREIGRCYLYACATDSVGNTAEAWLETAEGYRFTALAAIATIEKMEHTGLVGALTPAQAFGADFALEIEGTQRVDGL